jgi:hypothetical protein
LRLAASLMNPRSSTLEATQEWKIVGSSVMLLASSVEDRGFISDAARLKWKIMGSSVMLLASSVEDRGLIHDPPHLRLAASLMNPRSSTLESSSITDEPTIFHT